MIIENQSLQRFNTFGVAACAERYTEVHSAEAMQDILQTIGVQPALLLGGGSNILLLGDITGLTIHNRCAGIEVVEETPDTVLIAVGGGMVWNELVQYALRQNWGGLENLSLIPGTVGAAPVQNIGAYGVEVADVLTQVEGVLLETGEKRIFERNACAFGYRTSLFKTEWKGEVLITRIWLQLTRRGHALHTEYGAIQQTLQQRGITSPTIQDIAAAVVAIRQSKLPDWRKLGNAGSFFKNPIVSSEKAIALRQMFPDMPAYPLAHAQTKLAAGWLIDQAGWRGKRIGPVGSYAKQALVLVNYGGASGADVWHLAQAIQADVNKKFGIRLEPEVNILGA